MKRVVSITSLITILLCVECLILTYKMITENGDSELSREKQVLIVNTIVSFDDMIQFEEKIITDEDNYRTMFWKFPPTCSEGETLLKILGDTIEPNPKVSLLVQESFWSTKFFICHYDDHGHTGWIRHDELVHGKRFKLLKKLDFNGFEERAKKQ